MATVRITPKAPKAHKDTTRLQGLGLAARSTRMLSAAHYEVICSGLYFWTDEDTKADDHYYSKAWHRRYGAKITTSNRRVEVYRFNGRKKAGRVQGKTYPQHHNQLELVCTIPMQAWRGNTLLQAIRQLPDGLFTMPIDKGDMDLRLEPEYTVVRLPDLDGMEVYERYLGDLRVDYVARLGRVTYHDHSDIDHAVQGVKIKTQRAAEAQAKQEAGKKALINIAYCHDTLGFCVPGITAFCDAFGLDVGGEYTVGEIVDAVAQDRAKARPFRAELRTLGEATGTKIY